MKGSKILSAGVVSIVVFTSLLFGQNEVSILSEKTIRALNNEISGELAQEYIRYIGHIKRDQASDEYHIAAQWVADKAKEFGLSHVEIEKYPADDDIYYYMQKARCGWDAEFAELWIVEPREEKLTSYAEIPVSLANRSQSCDVSGDLVYIGSGDRDEDYANIDVKGKVVLAHGSASNIAEMAVDRYGALGVVHINQRFAHDEPDIVSRVRIFTQKPTFVFTLSRRRGEELRDRLMRGEKIKVRSIVKAEIHPGHYENVIATIPGTDLAEEEILLTAHLCHYKPGANDNASGSACLLEIGRSLIRLMNEGKIKQPKRTIRFLWIPEMSGSIAYAATHPEIVEKMVAGINLDMVGQYLNENNSTFFLHCTPHSQPHYINDLMTNLTEFVAANNVQALVNGGGFAYPVYSLSGSRDAFRYRIYEYVGGSDQWIFNDGLLGVPSVFFLIWPDRYYHTSGDKPEICDPTQLKRTSFLSAAAVVYLMDDCPHKARRLAGEVFTRARSRILREIKRGYDYINKTSSDEIHQAYKEALNFIEQAYKRELATLESVKAYSHRDGAVDKFVSSLTQKIESSRKNSRKEVDDFYRLSCTARDISPVKIALTNEEKSARSIIPFRNVDLKGPMGRGYLEEKLADSDVNLDLPIFRMDSRMTYEILNFVDGKRSLLDIRNAVSAEYDPVSIEWVKDFLEVLSKAGVVRM